MPHASRRGTFTRFASARGARAAPLTVESARPSVLPAFLAAFQFRNYRLLWAGAFLSSVGTWTQDVALAWLIHERMREPYYLGLRTFAADAPLLAFMLLGGAAADSVDRKRILLTSNVLQMTFAAVLGLLYLTDRLGIAAILMVAVMTGLAQSQSAPTYQAVLTSLVPREHIPNAVALNSLQFNLSRAIGPVIAGLLLARGGTAACFLVNVLSFVAVLMALSSLRLPPPQERATESFGKSLRAGLSHVAGDNRLRTFMLLAGAGSFLGYPLLTYLPVIAGEVLGAGAPGYSLLLSSYGAGAIVGAIATAHRGNVAGRGRALLLAFVLFGLAGASAVLVGRLLPAMALLFVAGLCMVTAFSSLNSLVQESAPPAMKGRVLSIYGLAFRGGMPLGSLVAGFLVGPFGAPAVIGGFSLALAGLAGAAWIGGGARLAPEGPSGPAHNAG